MLKIALLIVVIVVLLLVWEFFVMHQRKLNRFKCYLQDSIRLQLFEECIKHHTRFNCNAIYGKMGYIKTDYRSAYPKELESPATDGQALADQQPKTKNQ